MNEPKKRDWKLTIGFWFGTFLFVIPAFLLFGRIIDSRFIPVTTNYEVTFTAYNVEEEILTLYGTFLKKRNCVFQELIAYAGNIKDDFVRIDASFPREFSRPIGKNHVGPYILDTTDLKRYNYEVFFKIRYNCHYFWDTASFLGPINVKQYLTE